jgi:hypothetical protein
MAAVSMVVFGSATIARLSQDRTGLALATAGFGVTPSGGSTFAGGFPCGPARPCSWPGINGAAISEPKTQQQIRNQRTASILMRAALKYQ